MVGNGKTKPCRVSAIDHNKKLHDIIIKLSSGCDRKEADLAMEAIGSFLSYPYAFGSLYLSGFNTITTPPPKMTQIQLKQAANIFAFDALVKNFDRKKSNPNCLTNGKDFAAIDHELAFHPKLFSFEPNVWEFGYMDTIPYKEHIFYDSLRSQTIDFVDIESSWSSLKNERLDEYSLALPDEWKTGELASSAVLNALTHIKEIRDNIKPALEEIKRVLI